MPINKKTVSPSKIKQKKIVDGVSKIDKKKSLPTFPAIIPNKSDNHFNMDLYA